MTGRSPHAELQAALGVGVYRQMSPTTRQRWAAKAAGTITISTLRSSICYDAVDVGFWGADHHLGASATEACQLDWVADAVEVGLLGNPDDVNSDELRSGQMGRRRDTVARIAACDPDTDPEQVARWLMRGGHVELVALWVRRTADPVAAVRACLTVAGPSLGAVEQLVCSILDADVAATVARLLPMAVVAELFDPEGSRGKPGVLGDILANLDDSTFEVAAHLWGTWTSSLGALLDSAADISRQPSHAHRVDASG